MAHDNQYISVHYLGYKGSDSWGAVQIKEIDGESKDFTIGSEVAVNCTVIEKDKRVKKLFNAIVVEGPFGIFDFQFKFPNISHFKSN